MVHFQTTTAALFFATDIVGCTDLGCPTHPWDSCTVADNTYVGVGLTRIADVPDALDGISLVKGVNISLPGPGGVGDPVTSQTRPYNSVYYLGTPRDLDVGSVSGCAVVFNDPPSRTFVSGDLNSTGIQEGSGTCPDVIEQSCIAKLTEQAQNVNYSGSGACSALERQLRSHAPDECSDFAGAGNGLGNFTVASLGGLSSISGSQNSTSDCWPILPKSDNLAQFARDTAMGGYTATADLTEVYKITPILTVFTAGNGSLVNNTSAQLTCLKIVTTLNPNAPGVAQGAAPLSTSNLVGVSAAALATVMFTVL
ncbi:hypothetical protein P175DRAFT_0514151 [Aspergillus ochraceoroseus IBT 24754]|uniref:Uncharacterized protein n=1 Tax=Aspergillus ochraceoroseus IBT 24754 TaxID=1392256 RepID=A0A2T5MA76_9EURO|nr:uncharacterized protein P175DRAFT_0514151 [Aspergillus ochraceoroseus IBT 24754]PTU25426.1 hypothetical protein P175DRAFT_0514151 [Aspergillus ochraceoroseus IBT 24754]